MKRILILGFLMVGFLGGYFIPRVCGADKKLPCPEGYVMDNDGQCINEKMINMKPGPVVGKNDTSTENGDNADTTQLSSGQIHDAGVAACEPNGPPPFPPDFTACQNARYNCKGNFQQCISSNCTLSIYDMSSYVCTNVQIKKCKAAASWEYHHFVEPDCAYDPSDGPTLKPITPESTFPGAAPDPGPDPDDPGAPPTNPGPVWEPRPPINEDVPTVKPNIPTMVSNPQVAFEGSGCSLVVSGVSSTTDFSWIFALVSLGGLRLLVRRGFKK